MSGPNGESPAGPRSCRFCGAALGEPFLDLGRQPLANAYLTAADLERVEPFYPLRASVCERCALVQVDEVVPAEALFADYAYFSSYSDSWLRHSQAYAEMIIPRLGLNERSRVLEVGSNDGYLLQYFVRRGVPVLGIEPAANVAAAAAARQVDTRVAFFGEETARQLAREGTQADLLIGNNVLAQVPDLNGFVRGMKIVLRPLGVITLEVPHLLRLIAENQFDTIYHEHFSYFSLTTLEAILNAHGLAVFDVEELDTHGGSLRIYASHAGARPPAGGARVAALRAREQGAGLHRLDGYLAFGRGVQQSKARIVEFVRSARRDGRRIAGYGAPAKGNTLLNFCGLGAEEIEYTVDRSPHKQGLFLPGTHIPIYPPGKVDETRPDYLLILPWNLRAEIIEQMARIRQWGGRFVLPIPEVAVVP
ncbi:MAG: class I SAM-dependent methyltransferase [bacterium]